MFTNRSLYLFVVMAVLVVTACAPQVEATTIVPVHSEPGTLRLAVADQQGRPSDPYVSEFIKQVESLSNGNLIIKPIWDAAPDPIENN